MNLRQEFQKIINAVYNQFTDEIIPMKSHSKDKRTYKAGGGWGDRIEIDKYAIDGKPLARVHGWKNPLPTKGDLLLIPMESEKTVVGEFIKIEPCGDPPDMFFADVKLLGYEDEIQKRRKIK